MIRYSRPKSQLWGHAVGRHAASYVVERALKFREAECEVIHEQPSELTITWKEGASPLCGEVEQEIDHTLQAGAQPSVVVGNGYRTRRWQFELSHFAAVATWFDRLAPLRGGEDVVLHSSTLWMFSWRDALQPSGPPQPAGGMFGVHLGQVQAITTQFTFRDVEQYLRIKASLAALGLVELADKNLRPKGVLDGRSA
jgi:hypothetical protein